MGDKLIKLRSYFDELIGAEPEDQLKRIKHSKNYMSLRKVSIKFNVKKYYLSIWLKNYLMNRFGDLLALNIYKNLWPSCNDGMIIKKVNFLVVIRDQLKNYPLNLEYIDSIHKLSTDLVISRKTITNWIKEFLYEKYGRFAGEKLYNEIWNIKHQKINITYENIKNLIERRGEVLVTTKNDFLRMNESPTKTYIDVKCKNGHIWNVRVNSVLYLGVSCPHCNEFKCEEKMRFYMECIFKSKFPNISLNKAYGISIREGGRLQFDGYNNNVLIKNYKFRIAFEYDGIQHDNFPNGFHKTKREYERQRHNDNRKIALAEKNNTIMIRLKEYDGFIYETTELFPEEIIRIFQEKTSIKLSYNVSI